MLDYSILAGVILQIVMTAYFVGRLTQRVLDTEKRVDRIERRCDKHLGVTG